MDLVIPGLNNVVRYIRPFTLISWAWRRAAICAQQAGKTKATVDELQDFVDRIEVLFVWSQLLRDVSVNLPGRDFLGFLLKSDGYTFGGPSWKAIRGTRKYSTALSAPVNYGPAVKSLGWIQPSDVAGAYRSTAMVSSALDAFDKQLDGDLHHETLSRLGSVSVSRDVARKLGGPWALNNPSLEESRAMAEALSGASSPKTRRDGVGLILAAEAELGGEHDAGKVRRIMCGESGDFQPPMALVDVAEHWKAVQARQLFRLALEALLHWVMMQLGDGAMAASTLAARFVQEAGGAAATQQWLTDSAASNVGLVDRIDTLQMGLSSDLSPKKLPIAIRAALAASLSAIAKGIALEREDRLPLDRARRETRQFSGKHPVEFMEYVLGSWVFGQHVYWAVGRGLGDARSGGKTILRLKVVPEEDGWTLAPGAGANLRNPPRPTPDRLESAVSLLKEARML